MSLVDIARRAWERVERLVLADLVEDEPLCEICHVPVDDELRLVQADGRFVWIRVHLGPRP